jgi:hypothetical protein
METALLAMLAAAVVLLGLAVARSLAGQRRLQRDLAATRADLGLLQDRLAEVDRGPGPSAAVGAAGPDYVITTLREHGEVDDAAAGPDVLPRTGESRPSRREFASVVVTESVVKVAALAHGVRRALSPQSRNRIRFEMGREVKRSRRQRRRATKQTGRGREADPVLPDLDVHPADEAA